MTSHISLIEYLLSIKSSPDKITLIFYKLQEQDVDQSRNTVNSLCTHDEW